MRILVTGGAGYIGSITIKALQKQGIDAVVFDNLVQGHRDAVSCPLIVGDLLDREKLFSSLSTEHFDGVIHFAAYLQVGESMTNPYKYFQNNIQGGRSEEHTSELQSPDHLVCRLLLEKKKKKTINHTINIYQHVNR